MPDRYDEELERLRSMDVPDQWDDISRRATVRSMQPSEPGGRRARWPILVAAAILVLVVGATTVLLRDDPDVTETEPKGTTAPESDHPPSSESPRDAPRRPLAEEQIVARGEFDGQPWTLQAQPFENGVLCLELTGGGGGCGSVPTDESPLRPVYQLEDNIEGSRFVLGAVVPTAAEVTVELANGEELSVDPSQPTFGLRFYVISVPARPDAVAVTALDDEGRELERIALTVEVPSTR